MSVNPCGRRWNFSWVCENCGITVDQSVTDNPNQCCDGHYWDSDRKPCNDRQKCCNCDWIVDGFKRGCESFGCRHCERRNPCLYGLCHHVTCQFAEWQPKIQACREVILHRSRLSYPGDATFHQINAQRTGACFVCNSKDHFARNCPEKKDRNNARSSKICFEFNKSRSCKFGERCRFAHSALASPSPGMSRTAQHIDKWDTRHTRRHVAVQLPSAQSRSAGASPGQQTMESSSGCMIS